MPLILTALEKTELKDSPTGGSKRIASNQQYFTKLKSSTSSTVRFSTMFEPA